MKALSACGPLGWEVQASFGYMCLGALDWFRTLHVVKCTSHCRTRGLRMRLMMARQYSPCFCFVCLIFFARSIKAYVRIRPGNPSNSFKNLWRLWIYDVYYLSENFCGAKRNIVYTYIYNIYIYAGQACPKEDYEAWLWNPAVNPTGFELGGGVTSHVSLVYLKQLRLLVPQRLAMRLLSLRLYSK